MLFASHQSASTMCLNTGVGKAEIIHNNNGLQWTKRTQKPSKRGRQLRKHKANRTISETNELLKNTIFLLAL